MKRPCKHVEAGASDNGTGLCWACGANARAAAQLPSTKEWTEIFGIAAELRRKREERMACLHD